MTSGRCKLLVMRFFLIALACATSPFTVAQWDGEWRGWLTETGPCKAAGPVNQSIHADVKNGAFHAETAAVAGDYVKAEGKVDGSGRVRAHGTWSWTDYSAGMYIRGKFLTEKDFSGKYTAGRCSGEMLLAKGTESLPSTVVRLLHDAASNGDLNKAEQLIAQGARVRTRDKSGRTPLHEAARSGSTDVAELLITNEARVNAKDKLGRTPLHWAVLEGNLPVVPILVDAGANVNAKERDGHTPLHWAANQGHTAIAELLISHGANVNATYKNGVTPLYLATASGHKEMIELLWYHGGRMPK